MSETIELLLRRRSVSVKDMIEPGPAPEQLQTILQIGARVPDHGKLAPWRFILFEGAARGRFGDALQKAFQGSNPDAPAERLELEANRFLRAPTVVAVVSRAAPHVKIPEWEQVLSAGAVCQNIVVAATALGYAAQWITEWYAYDPVVAEALGLEPHEKVAGFIYLGSAKETPSDRARPHLPDLISRWGA